MRLAPVIAAALGLTGPGYLFPTLSAAPEGTSPQEIRRNNPEGLSQPALYRHVVRAGNLLFIAGQVSADSSGQVVGAGDMRAQVRQVLENLKRALASEGAGFTEVVKINIYTTDVEAFRTSSDIREEYFKASPPASTLVEVNRLARPEFLVEIEAVAVLPR